jgi:hypothetical protein
MKKLTECDGRGFTCRIDDWDCVGEITVEDGVVFLCQDLADGHDCSNKRGYKYSWAIGSGTDRELTGNSVTDLKLISPELEEYKDWQVGERIKDGLRFAGEIIFRSGELVIYKSTSSGAASSPYTPDELYKQGWRIVSEPEKEVMVELTMDDVAAKFKIDVKTLRIKDK